MSLSDHVANWTTALAGAVRNASHHIEGAFAHNSQAFIVNALQYVERTTEIDAAADAASAAMRRFQSAMDRMTIFDRSQDLEPERERALAAVADFQSALAGAKPNRMAEILGI